MAQALTALTAIGRRHSPGALNFSLCGRNNVMSLCPMPSSYINNMTKCTVAKITQVLRSMKFEAKNCLMAKPCKLALLQYSRKGKYNYTSVHSRTFPTSNQSGVVPLAMPLYLKGMALRDRPTDESKQSLGSHSSRLVPYNTSSPYSSCPLSQPKWLLATYGLCVQTKGMLIIAA